MNSPAVKISGLCFAYPGNAAATFSGLDLAIASGCRFGLFGPNGAGKTTLMNLMTGLLPFTEGSIRLGDREIKNGSPAVRKLFGFVPQDFSFYPELSPVENLAFFGAWSGLPAQRIKQRTSELLEVLGLADVKNKPVAKFSGGMKRRVNLAIGVIHDPGILFLDEPTVGVDIQTRHAIINYLKQLNQNGTTLVYTSHQLSEAEELCEEVAMIDQGRIVAKGQLCSLLEQYTQNGLEELFLSITGKDYRDTDV